jgi:hypothetical protein
LYGPDRVSGFEYLGIYGRIILKEILNKQNGKPYTGFTGSG